jgi:DNA polymerase I
MITKFMEDQKELVMKQKFVTDMYGRKRRFHTEIASGDRFKMFGVLRQVCNYPVQSSAGSFLKEQIIKVNDLLPTLSVEAQILLQIHDEIVLEVDENIPYKEVMEIKKTIETNTRFNVPIKSDAEISVGRWMDIVPIEKHFNLGA